MNKTRGSISRRLAFGIAALGVIAPFSLMYASPLESKLRKSLRVLIVGGGPNVKNNQVAIESNVRYLNRLIPSNSNRTILFADGNPQNNTVLFEDDLSKVSLGERLFATLIETKDPVTGIVGNIRKPNLGSKLHGACTRSEVQRVFDDIVQEKADPTQPLMLYFTGHGSRARDINNNHFDMWGKDEILSVKDLAAHINKLPSEMPVTLIMVQCFSGAFANTLFENADPTGKPLDRDIAGFFASVPDRVAAGCTPEINEANYRDFTSYFFAALSGRDRLGRRVSGADYNRDGKVGMNEAYCYTLIHDDSIDVPVCTSDIFLRRFNSVSDAALFKTPYSEVLSHATEAQRAALEGLSSRLGVTGEARLEEVYQKTFASSGTNFSKRSEMNSALRQLRTEIEEGRRWIYSLYPELRRTQDKDEFERARKKAVGQMRREAEEGRWDKLLQALTNVDKLQKEREVEEIHQSRSMRFVRLGKSVILYGRLKDSSPRDIAERYERLVQAESGRPF